MANSVLAIYGKDGPVRDKIIALLEERGYVYASTMECVERTANSFTAIKSGLDEIKSIPAEEVLVAFKRRGIAMSKNMWISMAISHSKDQKYIFMTDLFADEIEGSNVSAIQIIEHGDRILNNTALVVYHDATPEDVVKSVDFFCDKQQAK